MEPNAHDNEAGYFCGQFNAYITYNLDDWASQYRDSVSQWDFENTHPAVVAAGGLALCSLLQDMTIQEAIDELGIKEPQPFGGFAENYLLELGYGFQLLVKVDLSNSIKKDDGRFQTPPIDQLKIHTAYLYLDEESITSILDWAKHYYRKQ